MNCDHCESRHGCSIRKAHDDGTAVFSCGIDFGRDKSETAILESRRGKLAVRYELIDDSRLRSCRDWFDEEIKKRLSKFFAKRVKKVEADVLAWIKRNPLCYTNPCRAILDGICCATTPAIYPHGNVLAERHDVSEFFLRFPRALPTELKGIAV